MPTVPATVPGQQPQVPQDIQEEEINRLNSEEQQLIKEIHSKEIRNENTSSAVEYLKDERSYMETFQKKVDDFEVSRMQRLLEIYLNDATYRMRNVRGKLRKAILGIISLYNGFEWAANGIKGRQQFQTTQYTCGSIECKERGLKIKKALLEMAALPISVLGAYNVQHGTLMTFNHVGQLAYSALPKSFQETYDFQKRQGTPGQARTVAYEGIDKKDNIYDTLKKKRNNLYQSFSKSLFGKGGKRLKKKRTRKN